jgi:N-acetylmuramoyl-L-alanine amidase
MHGIHGNDSFGVFFSPTDYTDNSDINSSFSSIRSLAAQEVARRIDTDFVIDLHFNAHGNPQARGTETIVADDATELELRIASRLAHATADSLEIPLRGIKSESQTPHRRLAMLHLTPQSIILEVCFCTSPEDVEAYRNNREKLAAELAWAIAELIE